MQYNIFRRIPAIERQKLLQPHTRPVFLHKKSTPFNMIQ